jgi:hypothetical protein
MNRFVLSAYPDDHKTWGYEDRLNVAIKLRVMGPVTRDDYFRAFALCITLIIILQTFVRCRSD